MGVFRHNADVIRVAMQAHVHRSQPIGSQRTAFSFGLRTMRLCYGAVALFVLAAVLDLKVTATAPATSTLVETTTTTTTTATATTSSCGAVSRCIDDPQCSVCLGAINATPGFAHSFKSSIAWPLQAFECKLCPAFVGRQLLLRMFSFYGLGHY